MWGLPLNQSIQGYIERHKKDRKKMSLNIIGKGKFSKTDIKLKKNYEIASLIECSLHTGRTHQVRLHLSSIKCPLVGDKIYGKNQSNNFKKNKSTFNKYLILKNFNRQALHATHLGFFHPKKKKMVQFNCSLPEDINNLLNLIEKY